MNGIIEVGTGKIKVHNIFDELPSFMNEADCIFVDPPCSLGNINTFYTKDDRTDYQTNYLAFQNRLFECIDIIKPRYLYIEVFKSNKEEFIKECQKRYINVEVIESSYYHKKANKCWIIVCSNEEVINPNEFLDEQDFIEWVCKNVNYKCIGDLCMGQGLVGFYANKYGKYFVGTELNKKRLAVLIERIENSHL